jgi:hypothetical protein
LNWPETQRNAAAAIASRVITKHDGGGKEQERGIFDETPERFFGMNFVELNYSTISWRTGQDETANTYVIEISM